MLKLIRYYARYAWAIVLIIALLFAQAMTDLALPDYMSKIVDTGIVGQDIHYILTTGLGMLGLSLLGAICSIAVGYLAAMVAAKTSMRMRDDIFVKVENFSNPEFDKFSTASLITRSTNDIQQIQMLTVMLLRIVFYAPIMGIGGIIRAVGKSSSMSWIIALAVVVILGLMLTLFAITMPRFKKVQKMVDRLNLIMRERLSGIMVIHAFNTQEHEQVRFDGANKDLTKLNLFVNRMMVLMMPVMNLVMNGVSLLIMWIGAQAINGGSLQIGDLMAFIQYTMQIIMSFIMVTSMFIMWPRASVSAQRINEVLQTEPSILDPENPKPFDENQKGRIEFRNVSFRYPNATNDVLTDITFTANPGETTAFIGSTGSGKSTLVNLIPRFYDTTEGEVLVDGVDIRDVRQHDLRDRLGYIPQKGVLFSGTIGTNLRYAKEDATDAELEQAAEIAQASEFIHAKPEGYETPIAEGGTNVSGGQKQRLSIARALVKQPEIYIFDDTFSALDFKTDSALRKALKTQTEGATVLIVAQRISTIKQADKIIVLDEGQIAGIGKHEELMQNCAVYQEIAYSQLTKEELA